MGTTDNGYSAPPFEGTRPLVIDGASFAPGVKDWDPVYKCFEYIMTQYDLRVEWLRPGWCWGYAFRSNRNNPNSLSRHSGAIAVDANAPLHPNGVPTRNTFTAEQIQIINKILDEVKCACHGNRIFRWGGDYTGTPDAMHFEINQPPSCVASAASHLNQKEFPMALDNQTKDELREMFAECLVPVKDAGVRQTQRIMDYERRNAKNALRMLKLQRRTLSALEELDEETEQLLSEIESEQKEILQILEGQKQQPLH